MTGIVGSILNHGFQEEAWKRQARHEIMKRQLDQAQKAIDETILAACKRFYAMQKVFWSLESNRKKEAQQRWKEYEIIKDNWNILVSNHRSNIKVLLDPELSYELLDKEDARNYKNKESLHAMFVVAHYKLKRLLNYNGSELQERKNVQLEALNALDELGKCIGHFSENCYKVYLNKYGTFKQEIAL